MAEIPPTNAPGPVSGVVNPPKKETGKVQPKKETVRINLPPKPTAAPTIKLPTLPPGGPTGAPSPAHMPAPAAAAPSHLRTAAAPVAHAVAPAKPGAAPVAAARPAPIQRQTAAPAIQTLDKILIFAASVAALAAVGGAAWVLLTLNKLVEGFQI
jgi:hypothetical protein